MKIGINISLENYEKIKRLSDLKQAVPLIQTAYSAIAQGEILRTGHWIKEESIIIINVIMIIFFFNKNNM